MPAPTVDIGSTHLHPTADGRLTIALSGPRTGPARAATVTVTSARRIPTRWLGSGHPRIVTLGSAHVVLAPRVTTTATIRLSKERLALLHRMGRLRATVRVASQGNNGRVVTVSRRLDIHAPRRPDPRATN
jgi:hypothetical protein